MKCRREEGLAEIAGKETPKKPKEEKYGMQGETNHEATTE